MNRYFFLILILVFIGCDKKEITEKKALHVKEKALHVEQIKTELQKIDTVKYTETYIENIINQGSNQHLGFPTKTMDAGIAHEMDAKDISRYVIMLRGEKSSDDSRAKKAEIFYTSNCGGCHGNDGKGINGTFPDLTMQTLQGIKKRKDFLINKIPTSK